MLACASLCLASGDTPWWSSRYSRNDQLGSLNEIGVAQVASATRPEAGYVVNPADARGTLAKQSTKINACDAVLFHTGWGSLDGCDNGRCAG